MDIEKVKGVIVLIVAPVNQEDRIKTAPLERMVERVIQGGINGILASGSSREFFAIDKEGQKKSLQMIAKSANKRVSVYVSIGSITTKGGVLMAKTAEEDGADGLSILPSMSISPTDDELYQHIITIAKAVPHLSALLYNNPGKVGCSLSAFLAVRLFRYPNIVGIKDGSRNIRLTAEHIRRTENGEFKVVAGRDTLILGSLVYEAVGVVVSTANVVPKLIVSVYKHYCTGDLSSTRNAQSESTEFRSMSNRASFPVTTKGACDLVGLDIGASILPNTTSSDQLGKEVSEVLEKTINK